MGRKKQFWHHHENDEYKDFNKKYPGHYQRLIERKIEWRLTEVLEQCVECEELLKDDFGYHCILCDKEWHGACTPSSPDNINHPCHPIHPLKLLVEGPPNYSNGKCLLCQKKLNRFVYHCSLCDFSIHVKCANIPPPLIVDAPKCHGHALTLMAREDPFTCNACGMCGEGSPYVCPPCGLMFHRDCITLPRVININRHDHRISHTYSLVFGKWECGVCRQKISWKYGAYSCSICPDYAVHSKCATRDDVWDGVELEGVPEEFVDVSPYKVIEEGVINHFSHDEHNLRLIDDDVIDHDESIRCEACTYPIYYEKHYKCMECDFFLHETCANLPLQKRHGLCTKPLTLISTKKDKEENFFYCFACVTMSNGFRYKCGDISLDVRCATISWYCDYECHPHTLFLTTLDMGTCGACHETYNQVLRCVECDFSLDFKCANLPKKIKHRCDDHFLSLCFGEKAKGKYWCEVCETILDPQKWFYTCNECGVVCHIKCVLGEFWNAKPGFMGIGDDGKKMEMVPNNSMSRPKCGSCDSRCQRPLLLKLSNSDIDECFCKTACFQNHL